MTESSWILACALLLAAQEPAAPEVDLASLPLDVLIERLPSVFVEREGNDESGEEVRRNALSAELARRLHSGISLSGAQWRRALLDSGALCLPARWPVGVPYAVSARMPDWLGQDTVLILEPADPSLRRARVGSFDMGCGSAWLRALEDLRGQELGELALGPHRISLCLELRTAPDAEGWFGLHPWFDDFLARKETSTRGVPSAPGLEPRMPTLLSSAETSFEVQVVPTLDEAVLPDRTPELTNAVRRSLTLRLGEDSLDEDRGEASWNLAVAPLPELQHVGLSLAVQVLHDGETVERAHLHPSADREGWGAFSGIEVLFSIPRALAHDRADRAAWSLRVEGTNVDILRYWANTRWAGTLELTLDELLDDGPVPEPR